MASFDDSFLAFYEHHWAPLVEYCQRGAVDRATAEDAANNSFLAIFTARNLSVHELYAIANTERIPKSKDLVTPHPSRYMATAATPEEEVMHAEHKRRIHEAYPLLPGLWRTVLMLSLHGVPKSRIGLHLKRDAEDVVYIRQRTMFHLRQWSRDPATRPNRDTN